MAQVWDAPASSASASSSRPAVRGGRAADPARGNAPGRPGERPGAAAGRRPGIVWFRGDLRLHDHEALARAQAECSSLLPVYCFDPRDYGKSPQGYDKTGGCARLGGPGVLKSTHAAGRSGMHMGRWTERKDRPRAGITQHRAALAGQGGGSYRASGSHGPGSAGNTARCPHEGSTAPRPQAPTEPASSQRRWQTCGSGCAQPAASWWCAGGGRRR